MSFITRIIFTCFALAFAINTVSAQTVKRGTKEEAIVIAKKVKAMWKTLGPAKTIKAVNTLSNNLRNKDLYPWIGHQDGYVVAHYFQALRGIKTAEDTDQSGRSIYKEILKVVNSTGVGWVRYDWPNPITKRIDAKENYVLALDNEYFVAVGVFRKLRDDQIREY